MRVLEEDHGDVNARNSRLRFYFRSGMAPSSPQQPNSPPTQDNVMAQFPDRLSVSLLKGTRRIVIPATRIAAVYFNRSEGYIKIEGDGFASVIPQTPLSCSGVDCSLRKFELRKLMILLRLRVKVVTRDRNTSKQRMILQEVSGAGVKSWRFGLI